MHGHCIKAALLHLAAAIAVLLTHLTLLSQQEEVLLESRLSSHSEASSSAQPAAVDDPQTGLLALEAALEHVVEAGIDAGMDILDAGKHASPPNV